MGFRRIFPALLALSALVPVPSRAQQVDPNDREAFNFRGAITPKVDKELFGEYEAANFMHEGILLFGRLHYNCDGSGRFYGLGPDSGKKDESNFTNKEFYYTAHVGLPFFYE